MWSIKVVQEHLAAAMDALLLSYEAAMALAAYGRSEEIRNRAADIEEGLEHILANLGKLQERVRESQPQ